MAGKVNRNRLILGTVQFGLAYGISNKRGQISQQEVNKILASAHEAGINTLDTAAAYGESEASIGTSCRANNLNFQLITKYPPNRPGLSVSEAFHDSLSKLGVDHLHGYLLHSYASYSSNPGIMNELQQLKNSGQVDKIGISLYHPQEAIELLERDVQIDVVQFPYSVFDRRFEEVLPLLRKHGIETHVRSIYLQGLYFVAPEALPAHLSSVAPKLQRLQQLALDHQLPLGAMLLGFALANQHITNVVIGVESLATLQENIDYSLVTLSPQLVQELLNYQDHNEDILLPYNWTK
ncbi:aldo/keto reductase [Pontibacter brevis]